MSNERTRKDLADETYHALFGPGEPALNADDPELGDILRKVIFGDVFRIGDLDHRTREILTVAVLTTLQALPQLRGHVAGALRIGVTPVELREVIYQCVGFIGFPRTLNAVGVLNEVLRDQGIELPLPGEGTVPDEERFARGSALQERLYGTAMRDAMSSLPGEFADAVPRLLTEWAFGDIGSRPGLDLATRELVVLVVLATLGDTPAQISSHTLGNLRAGNSVETVLAALVHCIPYIGYPAGINAIRLVKDLDPDAVAAASAQASRRDAPPERRQAGSPVAGRAAASGSCA